MRFSREALINALAALTLAAGAAWFIRHTEWVDDTVRPPSHGEAARDTHYAIKKIVQRLGATAAAPQNLDRLPSPGATLVLGSWNWDIFPEREPALQRWVESGGHLWTAAARRPGWVPVEQAFVRPKPTDGTAASAPLRARPAPPRASDCHRVAENGGNAAPPASQGQDYALCGNSPNNVLKTHAPVQWSLDGPLGPEMLQVAVGRGSVTVALDNVSSNERLFDGDNALAFVASLHLHPGAEVWFVDTERRPPLLAQIWQSGAPAVLLAALLVAGILWRAGTRFGPLAAAAPPARRSVAEQIRGTAQFILQRDAAALHRAQLRALEAAARRRVIGHDRLDRRSRAEAIARATALDAAELARAMDPTLRRTRRDLLATLALLETAARRLALNP